MSVGRLVEHPRSLAIELAGATTKDLEQQGVLGAEVIVHRGEVDPGIGGDVAHRDVLKAVQRKQTLSRSEDRRLGGGLGGLQFGGLNQLSAPVPSWPFLDLRG